MAYISSRKRKDGSVAHYVRWVDPKTGAPMTQRAGSEEDAKFLLQVLRAHDNDVEAALSNAKKHYSDVYTVSDMIEDHISLLTNVNGYTVRRYRGNLKLHIAPGLGKLEAAMVDYRILVAWIKEMQAKGLSPKTIANVHGLISAAFNMMVRDRKRDDNPCTGVSLPRDAGTEEVATFLTKEEWELIKLEFLEPYRTFFSFLIYTGLRFSEATALEPRDFEVTHGQRTVDVVRAWTRDENNVAYVGPTKTKQSKRKIAITNDTYSEVAHLLRGKGRTVFLNTEGGNVDHRRAWGVWDRAVSKAQNKGLSKRPRIHDLRHSNASWLLQAGLDIYKLQKHLGHRSITTTLDRYSHLLPEGLRIACRPVKDPPPCA